MVVGLALAGAPESAPAGEAASELESAPEPEPAPDENGQLPAPDVPQADGDASQDAARPADLDPSGLTRKREWMLVLSPGFDFVRGPGNAWRALGGGFRFGAHALTWGGKKGRFLVGGGPFVHYSYLRDGPNDDTIHLATFDGELMLGGGNQRFGVYWHLVGGVGYLGARDGATGITVHAPGVRGATGVGGFGKIVDRFSIGALVDFGWAGGVWINAMLTANVHFGRKGDEL